MNSYKQLFNSEENNLLMEDDYYNAMSILRKSTSKEALNLLYRMIDDMHTLGIPPGRRAYHSLIYANGVHGKPLEAWGILDLMKKDQVELTTFTYNTLIGTFKRMSDSEGALRAFEEMQQNGLSPDSSTYNTLIDLYGKRGDLEIAIKFYQEMIELNKVEPDEITFDVLINLYINSGKYESIQKIEELREDISKRDITLDTTTYNSLIKMYSKSNATSKVFEIYEELIKKEISPDKSTYHILLELFIKKSEVDKFMEIYRLMKSKGIYLNFKMYDMCLPQQNQELQQQINRESKQQNEGLQQQNQALQQNEEGLSELQKNERLQELQELQELNQQQYQELQQKNEELQLNQELQQQNEGLQQLQQQNEELQQQNQELKLLQQQQKELIKNNKNKDNKDNDNNSNYRNQYRNLKYFFFGLRKEQNLVKEFLQEMIKKEIEIEPIVSDALIGICVDNYNVNGAIEIYDMIVKQGKTIGIIPFTNLTKLMILSRRENDAIQFYYEVKQTQKIQIDVQGYTTLIDAFIKIKRISEAQRLFGDMLREGIKPNVKTYTTLITGLGQQYDYKGVKNIHGIVKMDINVELDIGIYNALMDAYNRCGHIKQVLTIWDLLVANNQPFNNTTVCIVLDSCGFAKEVYKLIQIWKELKRRKFNLTINNYHSIIEALARNQLFEDAKHILFNEFISAGFTPEERSIRPLLNFLHDRKGKSKDEFQVMQWIIY
ncbi:6355_t:CDS:2 [Diversispora eburnea]|uniref:6355_t:CDS:1 n=1 Tax=Diversispora eburnea TaxID=1213867 RepID=A0A9N9AUF8_9GLOM|nr:6355_t:CDS:2 [Diversispora eburnea]